ncbi:MAG TPA: response regulator [Anaerolineales bacterium]
MKFRNTTMLLVEDNPDDVILTLRALKKNNIGNKIIVVGDGAEALDFLFCRNRYADRSPEDRPQLVLLDIRLPKIDGLEVLRRLRADERTRSLPVVMLTGSEEEEKIVESYKSGANAFMRKPIDFYQFTVTVPQLGLSWLVLNKEPSV